MIRSLLEFQFLALHSSAAIDQIERLELELFRIHFTLRSCSQGVQLRSRKEQANEFLVVSILLLFFLLQFNLKINWILYAARKTFVFDARCPMQTIKAVLEMFVPLSS